MHNATHYSIAFLLLLLSLTFSWAQQVPEKEWVRTWGGSEYDMLWESKPDGQGNIVSVGRFSDTVDFDPGPGVLQKVAPTLTSNAFIQKLDNQGNLLWVKTLSSSTPVGLLRVNYDNTGSMILAGSFSADSVDVDPDPGQSHFIKGEPGKGGAFLLKLNNQGQFIWARSYPGLSVSDRIAVDSSNNIYSINSFDEVFDANPDPGVTNLVYPQVNAKSDAFIQKLNSQGQQLWFKIIAGGDNLFAYGLSLTSAGHPVIAGSFKGSVDFDPGPGIVTRVSSSSYKAYVLRLDTAGDYQDVFTLEGPGKSEICDISVDANDELYLGGFYNGDVDFDPGPGSQGPASTSHRGWFFEKTDLSGRLKWVRPYYNLQSLQVWPVKLFIKGDQLYTAGYYSSNFELEPGVPGGTVLPFYGGGRDIFVARYDTAGTLFWAQNFSSSGADRALSVFTDNSDNLYISGYYSGDISFDPYQSYPPTSTIPTNGSYDAFVLKFSHCVPGGPDTSLTVQVCDFYETDRGQRIYKDSLVVDTLHSADGCDSLIADVQVEIFKAPLAVSANYGMIVWHHGASTGTTRGYDLQWFNCDTQTLLPDTGYQFTPAQNGSYAVIIEKDGCIDTSGCVLVNDVGLPEAHPQAGLSVYPNPTSGRLSVSGHKSDILKISVFDLRGRKLKEGRNQDFVKLDGLRSGTYLVRVELETGIVVRKVMRE